MQVKDSGAGIDPEDFSKLFNRFGKLHRTAKLNNEGIGLGLTIVKEIVEKCGGTIGVKSEGINRGSLFFFNMNMEVCKEQEEEPRQTITEENKDEKRANI